MRIGVPKEIKNKEYRVGMVVAGVRALTSAGHKVLVQHNAGTGAGISDDDYRKAGATIAAEKWDKGKQAGAEAEKMNLALPGLGLAKQLYEAVRAQGFGRKGTQALLMALEHLNNVKR